MDSRSGGSLSDRMDVWGPPRSQWAEVGQGQTPFLPAGSTSRSVRCEKRMCRPPVCMLKSRRFPRTLGFACATMDRMSRRHHRTVAFITALGALFVMAIAGTHWQEIERSWLTKKLRGQWQRAGQREIHYFWEFTPRGRWIETKVSPHRGASHVYRGTYSLEGDRIKVEIENLPGDESEREYRFRFEGEFLILTWEWKPKLVPGTFCGGVTLIAIDHFCRPYTSLSTFAQQRGADVATVFP